MAAARRSPLDCGMIENPERLAEFDRRDAARRFAGFTHADALGWFEALWAEAVALNSDFPGDWRADLGGDIALARAINGLPPTP